MERSLSEAAEVVEHRSPSDPAINLELTARISEIIKTVLSQDEIDLFALMMSDDVRNIAPLLGIPREVLSARVYRLRKKIEPLIRQFLE